MDRVVTRRSFAASLTVRRIGAGCESYDLDVVLSFAIIAPSPFQGLLIERVILVTQREPLFHISRNLLFFGRAPAHHTAEMRELRHSWGFTRDERARHIKALGEGRRAPSPALDKLLAELETRTTARAISHYRASILNEEMRNP